MGLIFLLYYFYVIRYAPPTFEKYVDLTILPEYELMEGVKTAVLFHAKRDSKFSRNKIGSYRLIILDGVPSKAYLAMLNEYDIPHVDRTNMKGWEKSSGRIVRIVITKIIPLDMNRMVIESEFQYSPKLSFSDRFSLEKKSQVWEVTDSNASKMDYLNIGNLKKD